MKVVLQTALPDVANGADAPTWVHVVPAGSFMGIDGRGPYILRDAQAVIASSMAAGKLVVDENHATDLARTTGQASPARGWIEEMQDRPDGIWGRVSWTPSGLQLLADGAYRGFSPVLAVDAEDRMTVRKVLRGALTNTPNLGALTTLHSGRPALGPEMLSVEDLAICHKMGIDPAALLARRQRRTQAAANSDDLALTDLERQACHKMNVDVKRSRRAKRGGSRPASLCLHYLRKCKWAVDENLSDRV